MPPELPNEQELNLKKRARRRLVGAIALVLLMVIVLPQVLQDRTVAQQESIKITMPEPAANPVSEISEDKAAAQQEVVDTTPEESLSMDEPVAAENSVNAESSIESLIAAKEAESNKAEPKKPETPSAIKVEKKDQVKVAEAKASEIKKPEVKPEASRSAAKSVIKTPEAKVEPKQSEHFTVQVGVYSDMANVKRLQDQLKQAGYSTITEKVTTPKGESIRLKTGNFTSRQDAVSALDKLKAIGLPGIVVSND